MKITLAIATFIAIFSLHANCMAESYSAGKTPDKPLRIPEDVHNMDRFLLQMTLRTILMSDEKIDEIVQKTTDDSVFRDAQKMLMVSAKNILGQSKEEIVESLAYKGAPKNEFEARRRASAESDHESLVSPVREIDYISVDISSLIQNSKYDFDKEGFAITAEVQEQRLLTTSMYNRRLPNWIEGGHIFDSFIKIKPDLAEKWREAGGTLRCVYFYIGSAPMQFGVYALRGDPVRYEFVDRSSSVIASVPVANVSAILDDSRVEYPKKADEKKKLSSLPSMLGRLCVLLLGVGIYKMRHKFRRSQP